MYLKRLHSMGQIMDVLSLANVMKALSELSASASFVL